MILEILKKFDIEKQMLLSTFNAYKGALLIYVHIVLHFLSDMEN